MTAGGDGTTTRIPAAIWCGICGIPYAAETVYCANCGAPLAPLVDDVATTAPPSPTLASPKAPAALPTPELETPLAALVQERLSGTAETAPLPVASPGVRTLDEAFPRPPRGLLDRVRQREQAMSEGEIDAAAAAIIAQARHADRFEPATGTMPDAFSLLAGLAPDPVLEEALRQRRERDRAWLIGGIVCCVLLIIFALVISRTLSIGMLRR